MSKARKRSGRNVDIRNKFIFKPPANVSFEVWQFMAYILKD